MKKTKPEANSLLRVPKAKNKLGLKINPIPMPHDDLIKPEHPKLELVEDTLPSMPSHTRQSTQTRHTRQTEIAPIKDFQKVPNSITKAAIPDGLFKQGKSKHLYDVLYSLTRGAIEAKRVVRLSKTKLRKLAGIGSRVTFDSCVSHLETVGLLKITIHVGEHEGNEFEVFLPEEISLTSHTSQTSHAQNPDRPVILETRQTRQSLIHEIKPTYESTKTFLKTNTKSDDEAFAELNEVFAKACEEVSGKLPSGNQQEKWKQLAELLVMELKVASARTTSVSDVPAFLTEHLRRRLMPAKRRVAKTKTSKSFQNGKQQPSEPIETYQAEPLSEQGRESTRQAFAGYIEKGQKEFLMGLEDSYTKEDWEWLMKELKIS